MNIAPTVPSGGHDQSHKDHKVEYGYVIEKICANDTVMSNTESCQ